MSSSSTTKGYNGPGGFYISRNLSIRIDEPKTQVNLKIGCIFATLDKTNQVHLKYSCETRNLPPTTYTGSVSTNLEFHFGEEELNALMEDIEPVEASTATKASKLIKLTKPYNKIVGMVTYSARSFLREIVAKAIPTVSSPILNTVLMVGPGSDEARVDVGTKDSTAVRPPTGEVWGSWGLHSEDRSGASLSPHSGP
ncbi:hypothetical protein M231_04509 [Tremella mesenterica]|uniref:Uncharacterized protein n=1 Tax=Tremella mesenterica TaxID=5217 RepID=A0A4Q1BKH4_TREME|nr:hypothetical protein M231_04509 [Tremella mesenterica]